MFFINVNYDFYEWEKMYASCRWSHPRCKQTRGRFRPFERPKCVAPLKMLLRAIICWSSVLFQGRSIHGGGMELECVCGEVGMFLSQGDRAWWPWQLVVQCHRTTAQAALGSHQWPAALPLLLQPTPLFLFSESLHLPF
jgi:hypothetical protein